MEVSIVIKHVNGLKNPKTSIEDGTVVYLLPFEVQLPPGDHDRIIELFRQRVPVMLTISSPQAKMDLFVETIHAPGLAPISAEKAAELRQKAYDALWASQIAERTADESGNAGDQEVAAAAFDITARAVTEAATALDIPENALLTVLGEEVHQEMLDGDTAEEEEQEEAGKGKEAVKKATA